ncbi:MAG: DMT family transporter [Pseudomonadota bacterium]
MTWITITLLAALAQTLRFAVQRRLRLSMLSSAGATFARFLYAGPLIVAIAVGYWVVVGHPTISHAPVFWVYIAVGGATQILATICLITLFTLRHFTVGVTLSNTQVLMTAAIGAIVLGDHVSRWALGALLLGMVGVWLLSKTSGGFTRHAIWNRATGLGLMAGLCFAICAVAFRGAALAIDTSDTFLRASQALMWAILVQSAMMICYLLWREPGQIWAVCRAWPVAIWVGLLSLIGSMGWFVAFALQNAAYVKALGQVEILFSLCVSYVIFGERLTRREGWGVFALTSGVILLVLVV